MKLLKKIVVCVIVCFLCFNSVFFSYKRTYCVKAVALPVVYGSYEALLLLISALGVACGTCAVLDYLDENSTEEEWENAYNQEKEMYEKIQGYYQEQDAYANAKVTSADGSVLYLSDFLEEDYMTLEEYKEYKKDTPSPTPDMSNLDWDEVLFSDELLAFFKDFFNEETASSGVNGQLYYVGDEGYINRETGEVNIYFEGRKFCYYNNVDFDTVCAEFIGNGTDLTSRFDKKIFRICIAPHRTYSYNGYYYWGDHTWNPVLNYHMQLRFYYVYKESTGLYIADGDYCNFFSDDVKISFPNGFPLTFGTQFALNSTSYNLIYDNAYYEPWGRNFENSDWGYFPDYISSNIPYFANYSDAYNYLIGNEKKPVNVIGDVPSAIDSICENITNNWVNPKSFMTTVNNICNNCVNNGITVNNYNEEYITYINEYYDTPTAEPSPAAEPSPTLVPALPDENGENTTNNYLINIQNIVAPIQTTVNNIYNFFIIDTEKISSAIDLSFKPAANFEPLVTAFDNMVKAFGSDNYVAVEETSGAGVNLEVQKNVSGNSGTLIADYPVISVKVPQILDSLLLEDGETICVEDGSKIIILCDFEKYAIHFSRFRFFMIAACWLGMLFYLQKELSVAFNVS